MHLDKDLQTTDVIIIFFVMRIQYINTYTVNDFQQYSFYTLFKFVRNRPHSIINTNNNNNNKKLVNTQKSNV